jgi:hypothetical protein
MILKKEMNDYQFNLIIIVVSKLVIEEARIFRVKIKSANYLK